MTIFQFIKSSFRLVGATDQCDETIIRRRRRRRKASVEAQLGHRRSRDVGFGLDKGCGRLDMMRWCDDVGRQCRTREVTDVTVALELTPGPAASIVEHGD